MISPDLGGSENATWKHFVTLAAMILNISITYCRASDQDYSFNIVNYHFWYAPYGQESAVLADLKKMGCYPALQVVFESIRHVDF